MYTHSRASVQRTFSPIDGALFVERPLMTHMQLDATLERAQRAARGWKATPLAERAALCSRLAQHMIERAPELAELLTRQMGRPIRHTPGELQRGFAERSKYMIDVAPEALADMPASDKTGFQRFVRHEPLGVVLVLAPWNYPYLTSVNAVIPALVAGNPVVLKHSDQTPLCAEHYVEAARAVGLPEGVLSQVCCTHADVATLVRDPRVQLVMFTGSTEGGHAVMRAASERFVAVGLELGGKDPAYVRADADLDAAVENLVDGALYNAGQSCCAVERIYVHDSLYDSFVEASVALVRTYALGNPLDPTTTLGPLARASGASAVRERIAEAVAHGARALIDERDFPASRPGTAYLAPQVLADVDHAMRIAREETFGPVVAISKVHNDEQALSLMNDSEYGLTASIWTRDAEAALALGDRLETGTFFMNRCDYLDPELAWTGVKGSGRGCTLSKLGYASVTRPKSFHLRVG
jgi:acyl-CoA reductase-like NAD-dependent aldehyde dehydrogenase